MLYELDFFNWLYFLLQYLEYTLAFLFIPCLLKLLNTKENRLQNFRDLASNDAIYKISKIRTDKVCQYIGLRA